MRRVGLAGVSLVAVLLTVSLAFGAGVSFAKTETKEAKYYEDSLRNLCVGLPTAGLFTESCGWNGMTGGENVGVGYGVLKSDTTGFQNTANGSNALAGDSTGGVNTASGVEALESNSTGNANTASGVRALFRNTTGNTNTASGVGALGSNATGSENTAIGFEALESSVGSGNVALGFNAGRALTTGSNNIDISNEGATGEGATTRIGTEGKQTRAFLAGVFGAHLTGCFVQVTSEGQLGCNTNAAVEGKEGKEGKIGPVGPEGKEGKAGSEGKEGPKGATGEKGETGPPGEKGATGSTGAEGKEGKEGPQGKEGAAGPAGDATIATFASIKEVASGNCLDYTGMAKVGTGACPGNTPGFSTNIRLAGPTPANGATVTNLYAETSASVSGSDSVLVAVIDNTSGATLLSCSVNSTNVNHCSNPSGSGVASGGDNIEVKITASGESGNKKPWRVTFRS